MAGSNWAVHPGQWNTAMSGGASNTDPSSQWSGLISVPWARGSDRAIHVLLVSRAMRVALHAGRDGQR
ncbi:hypothetical protein GCM10025792_12780 [Pseudonocardia tropica]